MKMMFMQWRSGQSWIDVFGCRVRCHHFSLMHAQSDIPLQNQWSQTRKCPQWCNGNSGVQLDHQKLITHSVPSTFLTFHVEEMKTIVKNVLVSNDASLVSTMNQQGIAGNHASFLISKKSGNVL